MVWSLQSREQGVGKKAQKAAEVDARQREIDESRGILLAGRGEDFCLTPGVVCDLARCELDEILKRVIKKELEEDEGGANERTQEPDNMVAGPRDQATDGEEEEQVVVKEEVVEEESREFENLSAGPGVPMVKIEMDLLEDMEVKTEVQDAGEVSQVEGGEVDLGIITLEEEVGEVVDASSEENQQESRVDGDVVHGGVEGAGVTSEDAEVGQQSGMNNKGGSFLNNFEFPYEVEEMLAAGTSLDMNLISSLERSIFEENK